MKTEELRKNNLMNLATILSRKFETIDSKQCDILSKCFNILSKDELSSRDSIDIDKLIARGKFKVLLPY